MTNRGTKSRSGLLFAGLLIAVISFVAGTRSDEILSHISSPGGSSETIDLSRVQETYKQLKEYYDGEIDNDALVHGASQGLVDAVGDVHTTYMTPEEAEEFDKSMSGEIGGGIGIEFAIRNEKPTVLRTLEGSPAKEVGVLAGDVIVSVNDEPVSGLSLDQISAKIIGEVDTKVKVNFQRKSDLKKFEITRKQITSPTVESKIEDEIGILRVQRFNDETGRLARLAADEFTKGSVKKVILDLRGNPGGTVKAAQSLAGLWLKKETIMTEKKGDEVIKTIKSSGGSPVLSDMKTVVLIDGSSASASEIVAAALRDYGKATLVGEKTYGKGSVQVILEAKGGAKIKITQAKWYTSKDKTIEKQGVEPDVKVEIKPEDANSGQDKQMEKAKEL